MHIADLNIGFDSGFTLVEVIVSTLLLGFVALAAILFLSSGVSGYIFSQQASAISQKASLALARLTKELSGEMIEITVISTNSVEYIYQFPDDRRHIALVGAGPRREIKIVAGSGSLTPDESDEGVLIDQVSAFTLAFKKCDDSAWIVGDDMDDLCKIELTLELFINSYDDDTVSFTTTVSPSIRKDVI